MEPGEIYLAFDGSPGGDGRPFVVVSREELNRGKYFLAVPFTSQRIAERARYKNCVRFAKGSFGLWKECVAQAEGLTQLRKSDLVHGNRIGRLDPQALEKVVEAVGYALAAECAPET